MKGSPAYVDGTSTKSVTVKRPFVPGVAVSLLASWHGPGVLPVQTGSSPIKPLDPSGRPFGTNGAGVPLKVMKSSAGFGFVVDGTPKQICCVCRNFVTDPLICTLKMVIVPTLLAVKVPVVRKLYVFNVLTSFGLDPQLSCALLLAFADSSNSPEPEATVAVSAAWPPFPGWSVWQELFGGWHDPNVPATSNPFGSSGGGFGLEVVGDNVPLVACRRYPLAGALT